MIGGQSFAIRCRRYAELLRKIAKNAGQSECRDSLVRFAEEFDEMARRASEPSEREPKKSG